MTMEGEDPLLVLDRVWEVTNILGTGGNGNLEEFRKKTDDSS